MRERGGGSVNNISHSCCVLFAVWILLVLWGQNKRAEARSSNIAKRYSTTDPRNSKAESGSNVLLDLKVSMNS